MVGFVVIAEEGPRRSFSDALRQLMARLAAFKGNDRQKIAVYSRILPIVFNLVRSASNTLRRMHAAGLSHGQPKFHQFDRSGGKVKIYDFETSVPIGKMGEAERSLRVLTDVYVFMTDIMQHDPHIADAFFQAFYEGYLGDENAESYNFQHVFSFMKAYRQFLQQDNKSVEDFLQQMKQNPFASKVMALPIDDAMLTAGNPVVLKQALNPGGIDLNNDRLKLNVSVQGEGAAPAFRFNGLSVGGIGSGTFQGLTPVILDIKPVGSIRALLGLSADGGANASS
jgi:tRNA A-37 threonylcarbamoyl transferase component Bud32